MERIGDTTHYYFLHDVYVDLRALEFQIITIRLNDVTVELLNVDYAGMETSPQLVGSNQEQPTSSLA